MPEERLMSITSSSHLTADEVARHTFGSVRRGFDPDEVRAYLESVAAGLKGIADRERQLLEDLADAEHRAAHPVLDEPTLTTALGTQTARVLHSAHEVAAEMVAKAEAEAARLLTGANLEIEQIRTATEARLEEQTTASEAAAAELRERTDRQIAAGLESARREADELVAEAREQCRAMVDEAQGLRARVLADMARRRKVLHAQIEQLRAGRERLAETVQDVRRSIDGIADDLFAAEDNARLAAEAAGREAVAQPEAGTHEELAAALLADEARRASDPEAESESEAESEAESDDPFGPGEGHEVSTGSRIFDGRTLEEPEPEIVRSSAEDLTEEHGPAAGEKVDALFAQLRAASDGPDEPDSPAGPAKKEPAGKSAKSEKAPAAPKKTDAAKSAQATAAPVAAAPTVATAGPADDGAEGPADDEDDDGGPPEERSPFAVQRDGMTDPIVKALARRLKRTLQDNQNEMLDSLRSKGFHWSIDLLPDLTEHVDMYATAALPALEQAAEAGASFVGTGPTSSPSVDALVGIAHELADAVVLPLRRKLSEDEGLTDAEESVVADHVGSAFRDWKGERIERLAGDHVVAAFSVGTISTVAADPSARLEWVAVAGGGDAPCPDCEDNGLNGALSPGDEYPTGHVRPPAHPGCRCLLVISAT